MRRRKVLATFTFAGGFAGYFYDSRREAAPAARVQGGGTAAGALRGLQSERALAPHARRSHGPRAVTVIEITAFRFAGIGPERKVGTGQYLRPGSLNE